MTLELLKQEFGPGKVFVEGRAVWLRFSDLQGFRFINITALLKTEG